MAGIREQGRLVRRYILENIDSNPQNIVRSAAFQFGISRQAVNKHLSRLVKEGLLTAQGTTGNRTYSLTILGKKRIGAPLTNETTEDAESETGSRRDRAAARRTTIWKQSCCST